MKAGKLSVSWICRHSCLLLAVLLGSACSTEDSTTIVKPEQPAQRCQPWQSYDVLSHLGLDGTFSKLHFNSDCELFFAFSDGRNSRESVRGRVVSLLKTETGLTTVGVQLDIDTKGDDEIRGFALHNRQLLIWGTTTAAVAPHVVNQGREDVFWGIYSIDTKSLQVNQWGSECPDMPFNMYLQNTGDWFITGNHGVCVAGGAVIRWEDSFFLSGVVSSEGEPELEHYISNLTASPDRVTASALAEDGAVLVALNVSAGSARGIHAQKVDSLGNVIWSTLISGSPIDNIARLIQVGDAVYAVGTTYIKLGDSHFGGGDIFIVAIDAESGDVTDIKQFGSATNEWISDAALVDGIWWMSGDYTHSVEQHWQSALYRVNNAGLSTHPLPYTADNQLSKGLAVGAGVIAIYGDQYHGDEKTAFVEFITKAK